VLATRCKVTMTARPALDRSSACPMGVPMTNSVISSRACF
jgi:hypothetical protein